MNTVKNANLLRESSNITPYTSRLVIFQRVKLILGQLKNTSSLIQKGGNDCYILFLLYLKTLYKSVGLLTVQV